MLDNSPHEEILSNVQLKCPLAQLETISLHPCHLRKETNTDHATASLEVNVENSEVFPQAPLLQTKTDQLPKSFL